MPQSGPMLFGLDGVVVAPARGSIPIIARTLHVVGGPAAGQVCQSCATVSVRSKGSVITRPARSGSVQPAGNRVT
jgi:hypothetical protein